MKNLLLTSAIALGLFVSCNKEEVVPPPVPTSNLDGLFNDNFDNAKQSFTINASTYNEFVGSNGVKIMVPANSFNYANGNDVVGTITFELVEILDQSSMILMNKQTTSGNEILVSGGQIKLTASQNGSQVFLDAYSSISVMVPTANPDAQMQLFAGTEDTDGNVDWILSVDDSTQYPDSVIVVGDSTIFGGWEEYYYFDWNDPNLGWINCDYFWNNPNPSTSITADLPDGYDQSNTSVFMHFSNINSVSTMYFDGTNFMEYYIPETTPATIVCISEIDGDYFSAFVPITVITNMVVNVTMNATTLADIETAIDNL